MNWKCYSNLWHCLTLQNVEQIRKRYHKISDFEERPINCINRFCDEFPMAPGQGLKRHSSISVDDPKHPVPLEQIRDLRRVPLPQVTEQRCQDCQVDHRGVTETNMLQFVDVAWSVFWNNKNHILGLFTLMQNPSPHAFHVYCRRTCWYFNFFQKPGRSS